jgi:hypothetical protein
MGLISNSANCIILEEYLGSGVANQGNTGYTGPTGAGGPSNVVSTVRAPPTGIFYPVLVSTTGNQTPYISDLSGSSPYALSYNSASGVFYCTTLNTASDIRIKQDVHPLLLDYATNMLKKMNPVEYKFKNEPETKRFGLIAQEIEETFKGEGLGLHNKTAEDRHYLSYLEIISPLIKVVNSLVETVAECKATIKLLEQRIEELENR